LPGSPLVQSRAYSLSSFLAAELHGRADVELAGLRDKEMR
jgi:hypothetical protein